MNETIPFQRLYEACNRNGWFTNGTNYQYERLFEANRAGKSTAELAGMIWLCSDVEEIETVVDILDGLVVSR